MFKILSIFFLMLTKKLDGQATGSANAPMPSGGVTPPMPMINATSRVPSVDRKNSTTSPLVPMPRDENGDDRKDSENGDDQAQFDGSHHKGSSNSKSSKFEHEHGHKLEHEHEGNSEHEEMETTEQTTTETSEDEERSCHQDNEIFDRCGGCEGTCTNPNPICTTLCNFDNAGCRCRDGFVRDQNGRCIRSSSCPDNNPPSCDNNEIFDRCGGCERTCTNPNPVCTEFCNFDNAGCRCRDGFVRDRNGRCIRPSSCPDNNPPSCDRNEDWDECGGCEATCDNPNPSCPFICGPGACRCRDGWVRDPNGNCVDPQQCFFNPCQLNEVFNRCSTGCEGNCSNTNPSCMLDSQCCRFSRCECPVSKGFVRDDFGNCIPSSQCPSQDSPSCSNMLCPVGHVCVMRKPSNCNFCSEQPTCIQMPTCQNMLCPNGFRCTIPSCQSFPYNAICVRSD